MSYFPLPLGGTSSSYDYGDMPVLSTATQSAFETAAIGEPWAALLDALDEALNVHEVDPDAQEEPSPSTQAEAFALLRTFPGGVIAPRPVIEPTGDAAWVWDEHGAFVVLAVSGTGVLEWTAVIAGVETHGSLPLLDTLQKNLRDMLLENFPAAHA